MSDYDSFVARKHLLSAPVGLHAKPRNMPVFDHQRVLVEWALRRVLMGGK